MDEKNRPGKTSPAEGAGTQASVPTPGSAEGDVATVEQDLAEKEQEGEESNQ